MIMPTFEELKAQLNNSDWKERRNAAKALGSVTGEHREEAIRALKDRLCVDDDHDIIKVIVETLEQTKALDDEVFEILRNRISEDSVFVRRAVIECLSKFQEHFQEVVPLLKQRLEVENERYVIKAIIGCAA
jgi:HEAT repeat protein